MGKKFWTFILLLLSVLAKLGPQAKFVVNYAEGVNMSPLGMVDNFFRDAWSPALLAAATALILAIWVLLPLSKFVRRQIFDVEHDKFAAQFRDSEQTASRQRFRWNLERAYRNWNSAASAGELPGILRGIKFPLNFPPSGSVTRYALEINWPEANGKKFWEFCDWLFKNMLDPSRKGQLEEPLYSNFLSGRRIASKFWDDWARQLRLGFLSPEQIKEPLDSNICDIRALAISELAMAKILGWDESRGKENLFLLARDGSRISRPLLGRVRSSLAAILSRAARWVGGSTTLQD